ncbi:hypothetical protein G6F62_007140 [Rhizopus arrhizus]|nr:hypothetical protein G6F62_007140 [Rhizopus arrhizus]KAG1381631.1 hypothetical protein G6F61_002995 [Rhizopus arrhizus]KAG1405943.1 hypothetical protein G6F60_003273 [Rhizopus arrhizus]
MATIIAYKEIDNAIEKLVDSSSQKNTADILCPKEGCKCVVLKKNTATLVEREGSKLQLPPSSLPEGLIFEKENDSYFWLVGNMMDFENIGFSKTVGTIKYLSCADCDLGPIGYHDTIQAPKEYVPENWDVDIIDYWGSLLKSYHKCHEAPEKYNTTEKVTNLIIENLPKETRIEDQELARKRQKVDATIRKTDIKPIEINKEESESDTFHDWTDTIEEDKDENNTEIDINDVMEEDTGAVEELTVQNEQRETPKEQEETEKQKGEYDFTEYIQQSKVPNEDDVNQDEQNEIPQQQYSNYPPQTATISEGDDDGLSNVIMAWYYAGYYTALYQSRHGNNRYE